MSLNYATNTTQETQQEQKFKEELEYESAARVLRIYLEAKPKVRKYMRMQGAFRRAYELAESFQPAQRVALFGEDLVMLVEKEAE